MIKNKLILVRDIKENNVKGDDEENDLVGELKNLMKEKIEKKFIDEIIVKIEVKEKKMEGLVGKIEDSIGKEEFRNGWKFEWVMGIEVEIDWGSIKKNERGGKLCLNIG